MEDELPTKSSWKLLIWAVKRASNRSIPSQDCTAFGDVSLRKSPSHQNETFHDLQREDALTLNRSSQAGIFIQYQLYCKKNAKIGKLFNL